MALFFPFVMIIGDMELVKFLHLFVAGIAFYQIWKLNSIKGKKTFSFHLIILITLFYDIKFNGILDSVFVGGFYVIFYLVITNKLNFFNNKFLTFLGTISYSLYLIHQYIGYIIIKILDKLGFSHQIIIIFPIIFSIILASILTFYVEKPIQKWALSKLKNKTETTPNVLST